MPLLSRRAAKRMRMTFCGGQGISRARRGRVFISSLSFSHQPACGRWWMSMTSTDERSRRRGGPAAARTVPPAAW